jgi:aspartate aminotransferase
LTPREEGPLKLAERIQGIELSPTFRINALAREMRAKGLDVLDFSVGEPDFPTPACVKESGQRAIAEDRTRYTENAGILSLREAIAEKLSRDNGLSYRPDEILVSAGAKTSLYFACMALLSPGDEAIVPAPYWVSYPEQVRLAGARPVFLTATQEAGFKIHPDALARAITPRTKLLVLNYPSNPTGACYDRDELSAIARVAVERGIAVVADEIYEKLLYDGRTFTSIASLSPEIRERTVVINGTSKAFAMTGWRIGYAAGPKGVIDAMGKVQSHATAHPTSISQYASVTALREAEPDVRRMAAEFSERRTEIVKRLAEIPGVSCLAPEGAFYVFPDVTRLLGRRLGDTLVETSQDLSLALLERARVAVVPGEAFGAPGHIRLSFAVSRDRIREGISRIAEALAPLRTA